ncbi:MAG: hypothetical protein ABGZ53_18645 [Fuerstiella sp.]
MSNRTQSDQQKTPAMALATTCSPDLIDDFLSDRLDDVQQSVFEHHLDQCDECCRELQQRTADHSLWNDARTFLTSTDNVFIDVADETTSDATDAPPTDMLRLDFLGPTDDPHMLGRFAGYEVSGVIGCGGMGIVLKGFDTALNRYAAIKVLAPHYAMCSNPMLSRCRLNYVAEHHASVAGGKWGSAWVDSSPWPQCFYLTS